MTDPLLQDVARRVQGIADCQQKMYGDMRAGFADGSRRMTDLEKVAHDPNGCEGAKKLREMLQERKGERKAVLRLWHKAVIAGSAAVSLVGLAVEIWKH